MAETIGAAGVALLLLAFVLNAAGYWRHDGPVYQSTNALGAALACYASYQIPFLPFVVLEGVWCFVALVALGRIIGGGGSRTLAG